MSEETPPHEASPGSDGAVWVFGYGSLIWKVDFPSLAQRRASISGWTRRFWQGSHDHRGTPEAPGRVVTLVEASGEDCIGMAYLVAPAVFAHLDHRERNGYRRIETPLQFDDRSSIAGVVYVASHENEAFLGPASERAIAEHIAGARGPSGSNRDYLLELADALRALDSHDAHVFAIEAELRALPC